jgi:hypothetical protein
MAPTAAKHCNRKAAMKPRAPILLAMPRSFAGMPSAASFSANSR